MKQRRSGFNLFVAIFFVVLGFGANLPSVYAQDNPNTITFDNKSGEPALVKLIGPTMQAVEVPNGESRTVNAAAGEYYILTRYGSKPGGYKYAKGDPFTVVQTESEYSIITITLHPVIGGNYATYPISADEFEKVQVTDKSLSPPQLQSLPKIEVAPPVFIQPLPKIELPPPMITLPLPKVQTFELPKVYELPKIQQFELPKVYELPKTQTYVSPPIVTLPKIEPIIPNLVLPPPYIELPKPLLHEPLIQMPLPKLEVPKIELPSSKIEAPPPRISLPSTDFGVSQGFTKEQFAIKNSEFIADCTGYGIFEISTKDEGLHGLVLTKIDFPNKDRRPNVTTKGSVNILWCEGLVHILSGRVNYKGYIFESDTDNPLQFWISDKGYVYQRGKGTITLPEGEVIKLPLGDDVKSTGKPEGPSGKIEGMVFIKGGCYEMGDSFGDGDSDEKPVHQVCVDDFYIGKYEVTTGEFRRFVDETGYKTEAEKGNGCYYFTGKNWEKDKSKSWKNPGFSQTDQHPVVCVSWNDAIEYTRWMGEKSGKDYRLPTEAEWEYAARSGGKKEKYAGFSNEGDLSRYANFCDSNCDFDWKAKDQNDGYRNTSPAGSFKPNDLGLYDMTGNVWEWVSDWYDENYYKNSPKDNPKGPSWGTVRVLRGWGWFHNAAGTRTAFRYRVIAGGRGSDLGFRLARTR